MNNRKQTENITLAKEKPGCNRVQCISCRDNKNAGNHAGIQEELLHSDIAKNL